jgi:hypothetical protein
MEIQDRLDATETLGRLDHTIDQGQLDRLDTVFTPDAVYDMSAVHLPTMQGITAIRDGALGLGNENPLAHHVTDIVVMAEDGDGSGVTLQSKGLMLTVSGQLRSVTHVDSLRRTDGGWRIARRTIIPQRSPLGGLLDAVGESDKGVAKR